MSLRELQHEVGAAASVGGSAERCASGTTFNAWCLSIAAHCAIVLAVSVVTLGNEAERIMPARVLFAQGEQARVPRVRLLTPQELSELQRPRERRESAVQPPAEAIIEEPAPMPVPEAVPVPEPPPPLIERIAPQAPAPPERSPVPAPSEAARPIAAAPIEPLGPAPAAPPSAPAAIDPIDPAPERAAEPPPPTTPPVEAEAAPAAIGGVRSGIDIAHLPTPRYPIQAVRRGIEGVVVIEAAVDPDGAVTATRVIEDPGHPALVDAAINAVRRARFRPATLDGRPVASRIELPFVFRLQDR